MKDIRTWLIMALVGMITYIGFLYSDALRDSKSKESTIEWLNSRNRQLKDGSIRASVLQADIHDVKKVVSGELLRLAKLKGVKSATIVNTETKYDTIIRVQVLTDTITKQSRFDKSYSDEYVSWNASLRNDSLSLSTSFKDTISVAFRNIDKKGWFTGKEYVVDVKSLNKYSTVKEVRSFAIPQNKKTLIHKVTGTAIAAGFIYLICK